MFLVSPGVLVTEKDLSAIVPAVATTNGATVGFFNWGPVNKPYLIGNEQQLVQTFGKPDNTSASSFFTASNFLTYSTSMWVVRAEVNGILNAVTGTPGLLIENEDDYEQNHSAGEGDSGSFAAKFPGTKGNGLAIFVADAGSYAGWEYASLFNGAPGTSSYAANKGAAAANDEFHIVVIDGEGKFTGVAGTVLERFAYVSKAVDAKSYDGTSSYYKDVINRSSKYLWVLDLISTGLTSGAGELAWGSTIEANKVFKTIIGQTVTVTIADSDGTPGTGAAATASIENGRITSVTVTNGGTGYHQGTTTATIAGTSSGSGATLTVTVSTGVITAITVVDQGTGYSRSIDFYLANGTNGTGYDTNAITDEDKASSLMNGYDLFSNSDLYDVSLIPLGWVSPTVANYVITNLAERRKDCVVFVSPTDANGSAAAFGSVIVGSTSSELDKIKDYKNLVNISSSYGFIDSGFKYQFDRYNDTYRWVPLNGDIAGLCARTDYIADPWFSPGGFNRGQIKGVVKLATNPDQAMRDELYKVNINPVVSFPNQGTVLYGDKTMQTKPSAFDRINVRRLFIVLEKAISTAAKYQLFELNDSFTRAQFKAMVTPFLRDVQGRRGLYDFLVVCDETNNTGEVIDRNEFVADIYIKPARSINYIYLNFIATRTDANFQELIGGPN